MAQSSSRSVHATMGSDSKDKKKKPYSSPKSTKLTLEQAKKVVADRTNCSEEEAADFLESLRQQNDKWKRSA